MGWVTLSFRGTTLLAEQQRIEGELMNINSELLALQSEIASFASMNGKHHCCHQHHGMTNPYMSAKMQTDMFIKQNAYFDPKTKQYYTFCNKKPVKFNPQEYFLNIMKHETKKYVDQIMRFMHEKEAAIMQKKQQLEMKLKIIQAERQQVNSAKSQAISEQAPKFA